MWVICGSPMIFIIYPEIYPDHDGILQRRFIYAGQWPLKAEVMFFYLPKLRFKPLPRCRYVSSESARGKTIGFAPICHRLADFVHHVCKKRIEEQKAKKKLESTSCAPDGFLHEE